MNILFAGNEFTNFSSRKGYVPNCIVNHITEGSKESCISWFTSPKNVNSSAHFLVARDGKVFQFVKIEDMAWGNGLNITKNPNLYTVSIEHEGIYKNTHGKLSEEQLIASILLHEYIIKYIENIFGQKFNIDRKHIIGHCDIDPIRKPFCPGEDFPYDEIISSVANKMNPFNDIKNHWANSSIISLVNKGILNGNGTEYFKPDGYLTRAEAAEITVRTIDYLTKIKH